MAAPRPAWRPRLQSVAPPAVSVLIHALLLVAFSLWVYGQAQDLGEGEEVRIAHLPQTELTDDAPELDAAAESVDVSQELGTLELTPPSLADNGQMQVADLAQPLGFGGGQLGAGELSPGGMGGAASFMGLQARGERFCIVADCSGSMKGRKLEHLKREVLKTIGGLTSPRARFQVYFFNHAAVPYPGSGWLRPRLEFAGLRQWLRTVSAHGGTDPKEALADAFGMRPQPHAIFFMTDGQFDPQIVHYVARLNRGPGRVPVHTITFLDRGAERAMRTIAEESGGKYRHVAGF